MVSPLPLFTFFRINFLLLATLLGFVVTNTYSAGLQPLCHDDESFALMQFKQSFSVSNAFASWKLLGNGSTSDCCSWDGVTCDARTGRVIGLDLRGSLPPGTINSSSSLFRLVHLQRLDLADNDFTGCQIPSAVGLLSRLTYLNFSNSAFEGQTPLAISNLTKLSSLDLSSNYLLELPNPVLTSLVQNLTDLRKLHLSSLNISSAVPEILANRSSLRALLLEDCQLQGEFPAGIFKLPNLRFLNLQYNPDLRGYLPAFHQKSPLKELLLRTTNFHGEIPNSIGNLDSLTRLDIKACNFSGPIPSSIGRLAQLRQLGLSDNSFSGEVPNSIGYLHRLQYLDICNSTLTGQVPSFIGNLTQLQYLDLSFNKLTGEIPSFIGNLTQFQTLLLASNELTGQIPSFIGNLTQLIYLALSYNKLTGCIPSFIGNLTQLLGLDLSHNTFTGQIPSSIGHLTQLQGMDLSNNTLTGEIPSSIGNLAQLQGLTISSNTITGQIPSSIGNLTQLLALDLSYNLLNGPIPESISQLVNITNLIFNGNNLTGTVELDLFLPMKSLYVLGLSNNHLTLLTTRSIDATFPKLSQLELNSCNLTEVPDFLKSQDELQILILSNNRIQGLLPTWIWMKTLYHIDLSRNLITGFHHHPFVFPWDGPQYIDLSSNMLQGSLPIPPSSTVLYNFANNKLTGEIPPLICNASVIFVLDLSYNNLSGIIPQCLGQFSDSLQLLNLRNNKLHGPIPQTYKNGTQLNIINFSQNQLQGPVPRSLVNCSVLVSLDIGNNQINDTFPFWLEALPELKVLILRFNRFHGAMWNHDSSFAFPKLHVLDISHNSFTGKLPSDYFETWTSMKTIDVNQSSIIDGTRDVVNNGSTYALTLNNKGVQIVYQYILNIFTAIDLSSNRFEGEIPESIGILKCLHMLNLSSNSLSGQIPSSFVNLTELESLDLSQNKLSGKIPPELVQLTFLAFFNVSHNHLTGPIPRGRQFDTFENNSYQVNSGLCGDPLSKKCGNLEASPPSPKLKQDDDDDSWFQVDRMTDWIVICIGYGGGLVVGLIIGNILTSRYHEWFVSTFGRNQKNQRRRKKSGRRS